MSFDPKLAERIDGVLKSVRGITIKKMFGGLCYMCNGNMFCGIDDKNRLMLRVGPEQYTSVLKLKNVTKMTFTGKPLKGFVYVKPDGFKTKAGLSKWINLGLVFAQSLGVKVRAEPKPSARIQSARNIGPKTGAELRTVGIRTIADLHQAGWQEAMEKLIEAYPYRLNVNMAYGLIGAIEDCDWRELSSLLKSQAKVWVKSRRSHF